MDRNEHIQELETKLAHLREVQYLEERVEQENERGGEAREVVMHIANLVGVDLTRPCPRGYGTWSPENMHRVTERVRQIMEERLIQP